MKRATIITSAVILVLMLSCFIIGNLNVGDTTVCSVDNGSAHTYISSTSNFVLTNNATIVVNVLCLLKSKQTFHFQKNNIIKVIYICVCAAIIVSVVVAMLIKIQKSKKDKREKK